MPGSSPGMTWVGVCAIWYHWVRNQHESLLIFRRGNMPTPKPEDRPPSVYSEARAAHSAKPDKFYEIIEAAYPELPKIELFSRSPRKDWAAWGNQAGSAA